MIPPKANFYQFSAPVGTRVVNETGTGRLALSFSTRASSSRVSVQFGNAIGKFATSIGNNSGPEHLDRCTFGNLMDGSLTITETNVGSTDHILEVFGENEFCCGEQSIQYCYGPFGVKEVQFPLTPLSRPWTQVFPFRKERLSWLYSAVSSDRVFFNDTGVGTESNTFRITDWIQAQYTRNVYGPWICNPVYIMSSGGHLPINFYEIYYLDLCPPCLTQTQ